MVVWLANSINAALVSAKTIDLNKKLYKAIRNGHIEQVVPLLAEGASVNPSPKEEFFPLHTAVFFADKRNYKDDMINLLITKKAMVNVQDVFGETPLLLACKNNHNSTIVKRLLDSRADPQRTNFFHFTPLAIAYLYSSHDIVELLQL